MVDDSRHETFVIAAASLAGATAAAALREEGFSGRIVLVGEEHERPYERPPVSKDDLQGRSERETAARNAGVDVTLLEMMELPLLRVLGPEVAQVFAELHRSHGVDLRFGVRIEEIIGRGGRVAGVGLAGGGLVEAEAVVVGVGITPNTELASGAGLRVDDGVVVDEHLRSSTRTSLPPVTSPTRSTRCWAASSVSSTGPTP